MQTKRFHWLRELRRHVKRGALLVLSTLVILSMLALSGGAEVARMARDVLKHHIERPEADSPPEGPLTDMAPPPPPVDVRADEHPALRLQHLDLEDPAEAAPDVRLSDEAEVRNPPQWTAQQAGPPVPNAVATQDQALALKAAPPEDVEPPNPFEEPPLAVNPARGAEPTDPGPPWMDKFDDEQSQPVQPEQGR